MRNILFVLLAVVLLVGCSNEVALDDKTELSNQETAAEEVVVEKVAKMDIVIENMKFMPNTIKVSKGTVVEWLNRDIKTHTVTADNSEFDSGVMAKGQSFNYKFTEAGDYYYHCDLHPEMKAKIIVE